MSVFSTLVKPAAHLVDQQLRYQERSVAKSQSQTLRRILRKGRQTQFGREHGLDRIASHHDFAMHVPVRDYDGFRPYVEQILAGDADVLWPGTPAYIFTTSGSTAEPKRIPISRKYSDAFYKMTRRAMMSYFARTGRGEWLDGKMVTLMTSPETTPLNGIPSGGMSGVSSRALPLWMKRKILPTYEIAKLQDWEAKVAGTVRESIGEDVRVVSAVPSWLLMYYDALLVRTGAESIREVFPNLQLQCHAGTDLQLHKDQLARILGDQVDMLSLYGSSEAAVAFQVNPAEEGLALNLGAGLFYEFVPIEQMDSKTPVRFSLDQVQTMQTYLLVITNSSGFFAYDLGDLVEFVSVSPPRIRFVGRSGHFISVSGERLTARHVETAVLNACNTCNASVVEFTVAPVIATKGRPPRYDWFVEFNRPARDISVFLELLDRSLQHQNMYVESFRKSGFMGKPRLYSIPPGGFRKYMKSQGRMGGQNKITRLQNDRSIADTLLTMFPSAE